jgi:hypothetical protein
MPILENTTYRGKQFLIGRMADLNPITREASKAIDVSKFVTGMSIDDKPQKETVELLANNGQQASDVTGSRKYSGTLDINLATGLLVPLVSGVIGADTQVALVAPAWATATAVLKDEVVLHSGGKYLVAQNDGTTGAAEPTITTEVDYDDLAVDGDVVWKLRDNLYSSALHQSGFCTDKFFLIERVSEGCGSSDIFDTIIENVELTALNIEKSDGSIIVKQSIPFQATKSRRSSELDYEDITFADEPNDVFVPRDLVYKADDSTIRVNSEKYGTMHNFSLNYTRNVTTVDSTEPGEQIVKVNAPTLGGEAVIELDPAEYQKLQKQDIKDVVITMTKGDGEKATFTYPTVTFDEPEVQTNGNEPRTLKAMMKPTGDKSQYMCTVAIQTATNWSV